MTDEEARAIQESAKAVQQVARTTEKALELAEKAGPFLQRTFGPLLENAVGVVTARLKFYRLTQFYELKDKTEKRLAELGVNNPRLVPPRLGLPLLEAATLEDREELHDLWARLLATAMDPAVPQIKRSFVSIVEELEPNDVKMLSILHSATFDDAAPTGALFRTSQGFLNYQISALAEHVDMTEEECELSLWSLERLGCLYAQFQLSSRSNDSYPPPERVHLRITSLGMALVEACIK